TDTVQCSLTNTVDSISGSPASFTFGILATKPELDIWEGGIEVKHGNSIDFGTTKVGFPIEKTIRLKNSSDATLSIYDINSPEGFRIISTDLNFTILPNQELVVKMILEAIEAGNFNSNLTVASNDATNDDGVENPYTILVNGVVENLANPKIQILEGATTIDNMINFGIVAVGMPTVKTFTIKNSGDANLNVDIKVLGEGFAISKPKLNPIAPGTSGTFTISLDADKIGHYTGILSVTNNSVNNPLNITVSGEVKLNTAAGAEIQLFSGATEIIDGSLIPINIGTTSVGQPITKRFTMHNIGSKPMDLYGYSIPNGFDIITVYPRGLAVNDKFIFDLQLNTLNTGKFNGPVELYNTDVDENPFDFIISGEVTPTDAVNSEIQVLDGQFDIISGTNISVDFGTTALDTDITKTFTIKNVGSSSLDLNSQATVDGSGFTVDSFPIPTQLTAGASINFDITLNGSVVGNFIDIVSFYNSDIDESLFTFPISGTVSEKLQKEMNCFKTGLISGEVCVNAQPFNVITTNNSATNAVMKGGLSVYQNGQFNDFNQTVTINQFNSVLTAGVIKTDSKHIGKKADILVVGYHVNKHYSTGYQWYQLVDCTTCPLSWNVKRVKSDETTAIPLLTKANLSPLRTINKMPEYLTVDMYSGVFGIVGTLEIYLAYRVEDGNDKGKIVTTSPGINITLTE
ncbi:choice-of-anchor D domain-containing protein, partial [Thiotrichales bacterium HSG1]|nr:choice-of-anchor D domain-containing protein [Thiotrichales bacterium HSG1]